MRYSGRHRQSKLKVRRSGVTRTRRRNSDITKAATQRQLHSDDTLQIAVVPDESDKIDQNSLYTMAAKGASTFLLLVIALNWNFSIPFEFQQKNSAQSSTSLVASISSDKNQNDNATEVIPEPATEVKASTGLTVDRLTANSTAEAANIEASDIPFSGITSDSQSTNTAPVQLDSISASKSHFVKAYRATIFSSLSTDAKESSVAHGTEVNVLERVNDWVKVEIIESGLIGYIHISHLSIQ